MGLCTSPELSDSEMFTVCMPTGAVAGQIKNFVERFPKHFRMGAMSSIVLPMKARKGPKN